MKTVLVTGSTGFIGSNLARELVNRGLSVRAFHRPASNTFLLNGIDVEHITGDILDMTSLRCAMRGCDTVFHTAGIVSFWKGKKEEQIRVNIEGSRNIARASLDSNIETLVHTSSVAAIGHKPDGSVSDEDTPYNWGDAIVYRYTKHLAELEIMRGAEQGLRAVIVNPSIVIGPGDRNEHGGRLIIDVKRGHMPFYTSGGTNIVGIGDVVQGHLKAAERGRTGERYILSGSNFTHYDLLKLIAKLVNGQPPFIRIPPPLVVSAGKIFDAYGQFTKREPALTSALSANIIRHIWFTCKKATAELDYHPSPVEDSIIRAYEWYKKHGILF
jgi:dihydroflavonol-4-reductase